MRKLMMAAGMSAILFGGSTVFAEPQPQMRKAMEKLESALKHLKDGTADKGGHRVKAIELVEAAMVEVRAGMEFDNKH